LSAPHWPAHCPTACACVYFSLSRQSPRFHRGFHLIRLSQELAYFLSPTLAYLRRKRSTRPAVSTSFCLPVKKGWQWYQLSTWMSPLWVELVVKVLPHAQCTRTSL